MTILNKQLKIAAEHFSTAIRLDPSYQKAYHNLAMCYFMAGQAHNALKIVDEGLALNADNRNSLLLKSTILEALDRKTEAREIADQAEFLPESNWSERSAIVGEK
jgi:tetratricopeptide (TPR) repeat protein